ncbi:hypothetical protein JTE90_008719 [Oedothorax gibbosus]|uniref:D-isomer specific 2-hydroxyacid dehydrogenase NAD-binding domain-containing protein n=1 Tax=Oedothorax gibbosus TaxID=931172 RepID=A0AAV6UR19_9ARAC|nr:hypothetical protein JTE90_008719 [Oedothorax gibbosus]
METSFPDVYLVSKFPGIASHLKNYLPKECNLVIVPPTDTVKRWDQGIPLSEEIMSRISDAKVLVVDCTYLADILYKLPNAKWIQTTWAGLELLMGKINTNQPPNFTLTRYVDPYFGELMSNYVIAQIINIERGFYLYHDKQKTAEWSRPFFPDFRVLSDLTVGILGAGKLGTAVGKLLKSGGVHVLACVRSPRNSSSESYDKATTDLNEVLGDCDYLCNVLPSTNETKGLLDNDVLQNCKKKPVFINIGRGDIIKESNIIKALKEGWISKAVIDVFESEPLSPESPLWSEPGVIITPHVGAIPRIAGIAEFIAQNYSKYVKGEPLMNVVDWKKGY